MSIPHAGIPHAGQELMARIAQHAAFPATQRLPLRIQGGGTKSFFGHTAQACELLSTQALSGIVSYEPSELVITAYGGTPLADIEVAVAAEGQCLAFEPPHFQGNATLGGAVASGMSGPARASVGAARDFVLGVQLISGHGQWLKFGGQVMKNVAGYDMSRLACGSWGTLGVVAEVSLKVLPKPRATATVAFDMPPATALQRINEWGGKPLPLNASVWCEEAGKPRFYLRLSGAEAAVASACTSLGGEVIANTQAFWNSWRDQTAAFFTAPSPAHSLWRLSVAQTAPAIDLPHQAIEWHGGQRWVWAVGKPHEDAVIFVASNAINTKTNEPKGQYLPKNAAMQALNARVMAELDPNAVFDRARMLGH